MVNLQFSQQWDMGWDRAGLCRPGWVELQVFPLPTRGLKIGGSHSSTVPRTRLNLHWQALFSVLATCDLSPAYLSSRRFKPVDRKSSWSCHPDVDESKVGWAGGLAWRRVILRGRSRFRNQLFADLLWIWPGFRLSSGPGLCQTLRVRDSNLRWGSVSPKPLPGAWGTKT